MYGLTIFDSKQSYLHRIYSFEILSVLFGLCLTFYFDSQPDFKNLSDLADLAKNPSFLSVESFLFLFYLLE